MMSASPSSNMARRVVASGHIYTIVYFSLCRLGGENRGMPRKKNILRVLLRTQPRMTSACTGFCRKPGLAHCCDKTFRRTGQPAPHTLPVPSSKIGKSRNGLSNKNRTGVSGERVPRPVSASAQVVLQSATIMLVAPFHIRRRYEFAEDAKSATFWLRPGTKFQTAPGHAAT